MDAIQQNVVVLGDAVMSVCQEDASFLTDCASLLLEKELPGAALDVCSLSPPSHPHPHLSLLTVRLEAMGKLRRDTEMETYVKDVSLFNIRH